MKSIAQLVKNTDINLKDTFPKLKKYSKNKYYKVLGSLVVGIEFIDRDAANEYTPHFVIYPLWGNKIDDDLKSCLTGPIVCLPFIDENGKEVSCKYANNEHEFSTMLNTIKKQLPFSFEGNVSMDEVFAVFDNYSQKPPLYIAPNSYLQASLFKFKLEMAICSGSENKIFYIFDQIKDKKWDLENFDLFGVNYSNWLNKLKDQIKDKGELISTLRMNKSDKRLARMLSSELV